MFELEKDIQNNDEIMSVLHDQCDYALRRYGRRRTTPEQTVYAILRDPHDGPRLRLWYEQRGNGRYGYEALRCALVGIAAKILGGRYAGKRH